MKDLQDTIGQQSLLVKSLYKTVKTGKSAFGTYQQYMNWWKLRVVYELRVMKKLFELESNESSIWIGGNGIF